MILVKERSDILGTLASFVCLMHCIATPFVFIAKSCTASCCSSTPIWWKFIDYIFLIVSFSAIYYSTKATNISWVKPMMWLSWFLLFAIIVNEKVALVSLPESSIYIPAVSLMMLHLYNKRYCNCNND